MSRRAARLRSADARIDACRMRYLIATGHSIYEGCVEAAPTRIPVPREDDAFPPLVRTPWMTTAAGPPCRRTVSRMDEHQLDAYVQAGLRQLDSYLTGRDTIA